jgi:hypothetical protein
MPELPRILPHIYVENSGLPERYTSQSRGNTPSPPTRQRAAHAEGLLRSLNAVLEQVQVGVRADRAEGDGDSTGFVLELRLPLGTEKFVEKLEDRRQNIELLSVSDRG